MNINIEELRKAVPSNVRRLDITNDGKTIIADCQTGQLSYTITIDLWYDMVEIISTCGYELPRQLADVTLLTWINLIHAYEV